ncbi:hypothetical protein EG328_008122 [Venturia inaequalis]|uniref:Uncharacterized protein n=1 Tax=Venturia inaequalis TaxID=5025 RepID=A0A8H3Z4C9_VENIN|nr:hypothetical protein EG328_008122 [Venturia inaequalis]
MKLYLSLLTILGLTSTVLAQCRQPGQAAEYNDCGSCCKPYGCTGSPTRYCKKKP